MNLRLFKTLWGHTGTFAEAIANAQTRGFGGIEGPTPATTGERREWRQRLDDAGLDFIAEICTAGSYVPERRASPVEHLESFRMRAEWAVECEARFVTSMAGCDAWPVGASVEFFGAAQEEAERLGILASFETHRSRSFFNPWTTRDILLQIPTLRITCDFSHWCCVAERLVMETEPEVMALCAERVQHIHARVGYDQGPQVPHPAAPEYREAVEAHERWWSRLWQAQAARGVEVSTMTPEFGPDGYLHCAPFTREPVADLAEINAWVAERQRQRFALIFGRTEISHS